MQSTSLLYTIIVHYALIKLIEMQEEYFCLE